MSSVQFSSVTQSCLILCDPMNHSTQGLPVHHHLPEFTQTKAHLTSHSRMSGPRCVITASWISGSWRLFLYSSPGYSYHLFLISSASVRSISFLSFIEPIFAWNVSLVSPILLKKPLVLPILLFSSISLHCSLKKAFLSLLGIFLGISREHFVQRCIQNGQIWYGPNRSRRY